MNWPDLVRLIALTLGALVSPMMFVVLFLHFKAWRSIRTGCKQAGLLPLHVACMSASYGILSYGLMVGIAETIGEPWNPRIAVYAIGFALGLASLVVMGKRQSRRLKFTKKHTTVMVEEDTLTQQED